MTRSDEELDDRRRTQRRDALVTAAQARGFKMFVGYDTAAIAKWVDQALADMEPPNDDVTGLAPGKDEQ